FLSLSLHTHTHMQASAMGMDWDSVRYYMVNSPRLYSQWWWKLVQEDPGHVVVETALIAFIVYILVVKKTVNPKVRC
ncbi:unnamed protein product, partial [Discosporangium mesarthrocarpum]